MKPEFTQDFFSQHIPNWTEWLAPFKGKRIQALEIGSFEGRSALWLLENILTHKDSYLICVDTWQAGGDLPPADPCLFKRFAANMSRHKERVIPYRMRSVAALLKLETNNPTADRGPHSYFDFIYVDGSHAAQDVMTDAVLAWLLLRPGGILIFDDYGWGVNPDPKMQPRPAVDAFLNCFTGYRLIYMGWQVAVQKI